MKVKPEFFTIERKRMVLDDLQARGINNKRVLEAMLTIPRESFVPPSLRLLAYDDKPLPIGEGQTISQPYIVALMTELLELVGQEKVLEIGTGSGYQAAILAKLTKQVYTIERKEKLLVQAISIFKKLKIDNIKTKVGDGSLGWPEQAPYQAIMVTAAAKRIPQDLIEQLAENGRLVIPIGDSPWQELIRLTKKKNKLVEENFGGCAFVPLIETV